jgi:hypothetical protein
MFEEKKNKKGKNQKGKKKKLKKKNYELENEQSLKRNIIISKEIWMKQTDFENEKGG